MYFEYKAWQAMILGLVMGICLNELFCMRFTSSKLEMKLPQLATFSPNKTISRKQATVTDPGFTNASRNKTAPSILLKNGSWNAMLTIQSERQNTLLRTCRKLKNEECFQFPRTPNRDAMYSSNYQLAVCEIFKAGSSSWLKAIASMQGVFEKLSKLKGSSALVYGLREMRIKTRRNATQQQIVWDRSTTVITVRNPFERLVSAYNDKMLPTSPGFSYVYGPLSRNIYKRFRHLRSNPVDRNCTTDNGTASFEDFLNFLVKTGSNNVHWRPYFHKCSPCHFHYKYTIKFDTLNEDISFLTEKTKISDELKKMIFAKRAYKSNAKLTQNMFANIPLELSQKLYKRYQLDFELFGYPQPDFLCK